MGPCRLIYLCEEKERSRKILLMKNGKSECSSGEGMMPRVELTAAVRVCFFIQHSVGNRQIEPTMVVHASLQGKQVPARGGALQAGCVTG